MPFTVIDEAVHLLDTSAEPWGIQLELGFDGRIDERRLRHAVGVALRRHPLARVRQLPTRQTNRTWCWEVVDEPDLDPVRAIDCPDDASLDSVRDALYSRRVSLDEAPPLRLVLARCPGGDTILLNANHAAFDGMACVRLMTSVARAYTGDPDPAAPVSLDRARDVMSLLTSRDWRVRARRLAMIASKASDMAMPTSRLAADDGTDQPGYGFHHLALSRAQTEALGNVAGATVNDLLLAALTEAIVGWNREHGHVPGRIGILMPVNLRPREWRQDIVTNLVLNARVVTSRRQRRGGRLLDAVGRQTRRIKDGGGAALVEVASIWTSLPVWAKRWLSPMLWFTGNRLVDTALLSNLGEPDLPDFGPGLGTPASAWFSAPARMPCGLSVGAVTVAGRLHLSFRYRHPLLGPSAVDRLARRLVEDLERVSSP